MLQNADGLVLMLKADSDKPIPGPEYALGARFNFALFVDDICLESMDHMKWTVFKIMSEQWGYLKREERQYDIHPDSDDGVTEYGEKEGCWMDVYVCS